MNDTKIITEALTLEAGEYIVSLDKNKVIDLYISQDSKESCDKVKDTIDFLIRCCAWGCVPGDEEFMEYIKKLHDVLCALKALQELDIVRKEKGGSS